ncbi:MAG: extracellular solute-binding protein [Chloroflexi bacterium]|nr:extracellular solute-binding protein [Chloroflexota bacterium]
MRKATRRWVLGTGATWGTASLAGAVGLAACMPGDQSAGRAADGTPVQLTYLHQWSPTQGHGPITDTLVARFKEQHPSIQVEGIYTADYYAKLAAVLAGGDFPDIVTYNLAFVPLLVKKGVVVPAESLSKGNHRLNLGDLVPAARDMATFDGKLAVTPYVLNSSGLALNASLYRQKGMDHNKSPATWNDLVDHARRLTGRDGEREIWGTVFPRGTADPISPLLAFIWQNGGELVDMKRRVAVWNSPAAIEALQFQVDLVHRHRVAPYPNPANGEQGNVGIWHIPPGNVSAIQIRVRDAFEWTTAELPKGKQQATTVGGHSLAVLKTNKHHEKAWQFVHWYTAPAVNAEYLVATTTLPPRPSRRLPRTRSRTPPASPSRSSRKGDHRPTARTTCSAGTRLTTELLMPLRGSTAA